MDTPQTKPDYYIYIEQTKTQYGFLKILLIFQKSYIKESIIVITADIFQKIKKTKDKYDNIKSYRPITDEDITKYNDPKMKGKFNYAFMGDLDSSSPILFQ